MKTSYLTKGGILTALTIIFLYLASVLPTNKLSFITLSSVMVPLGLILTNIRGALLVYFTSGILSIFFVNKTITFLYIFFFGIYGIIKHYIERVNKLSLEYLLKILIFNILLFLCYNFASNLILSEIQLKFSLTYLIILFQFVFIVYDYALTLIISYILKRFKL